MKNDKSFEEGIKKLTYWLGVIVATAIIILIFKNTR